jgi:hypothetical protein
LTRFIAFLLGKNWEPCQSCENLKEQLRYERDNNLRLTETLVRIVSPKAVEAATPVELNPLQQSTALFSRRRAALEAKDRMEAQILKNSTNLGKPDDSIRKLEDEMGIADYDNSIQRAEEGV